MPDKLRGIFFIEPDDEEFKHTIKNAIRKLEIPMQAAMPCKTPINSSGVTYRGIGKNKTKHACIAEADESTRIRLEGVLFSYHEDHIAAKRNKFTESLQFGAQIYPMPQALTIPDAKAAVENESENWKRFRHGS